MNQSDLVQALQAKGYSRRRAAELVQLVLTIVKKNLHEGKAETPIGDFELREAPKPRRFWRLDKIVTHYQRSKRIVFKPIKGIYE